MDPQYFEEVISILARNGRPDLIEALKEHTDIDEDYVPEKRKMWKRDIYSESEGSAEEEDLEVEIDDEGFFSLKDNCR